MVKCHSYLNAYLVLRILFELQERARSSRKVQFKEKVEAKPGLALAYLEYLFSCSSAREKVLDVDKRRLRDLHTVLERWTVGLTDSEVASICNCDRA